MTNPLQKSGDPVSQLQRQFADLQRLVNEALRRPAYIPILEADPPVDDPTNMWLFPDGRLRMRHLNPAGSAFVTREYVSTAPGAATSSIAKAAPAPAHQIYQTSWPATWSQSYRSTGAARTDNGTVLMYYGDGGDVYGRNQALAGFDYTAIAAELASSTINGVWLTMVNLHGYVAPVTVYFGIHNYTSEPATWAGGGIPRSRIISHQFGRPEERTVTMPLEFAQAIRDGWGKGIALEAPSSSNEFYGYAAGVGSGNTVPTLIVNYTK